MCNIYNTIGSLNYIKAHLEQRKISDFKSIKDILEFQKNYHQLKENVLLEHREKINREKEALFSELISLRIEIDSKKSQMEDSFSKQIQLLKQNLEDNNKSNKNYFLRAIYNVKQWNYRQKIKRKEAFYKSEINSAVRELENKYEARNTRYNYLTSNFEKAIWESSELSIWDLDKKKDAIDNINSYIYGAIGEQKVVKALESLPDDFHLINDFNIQFYPPIINRQTGDYIKSVQIDHILIGPCGVFLIETKNWSEKSIQNLSLRSPVDQIIRSNFAMFQFLNNGGSYKLSLNEHHWGKKKIPIKNLIVLINSKPIEEFQYVKILTVRELVKYINYFDVTLSTLEVNKITELLLDVNKSS